jgi:membrane protease YdiL (CAAX protease family)
VKRRFSPAGLILAGILLISAALALGGKLLLSLFGLQYRPWVLEVLFLLAALALAGLLLLAAWKLFQFGRGGDSSSWRTVARSILCDLGVLALLLILPIYSYLVLLGFAFSCTPEHSVYLNGEPVVACVRSFLDVNVAVYRPCGPLLMSQEMVAYYNYGNGSYDPFEREELPEPFTAEP